MEQYLTDTNAISDYFSASFSSRGMTFMDVVVDATPKLSIITQIELLCWKADKGIEKKIRGFVNDSLVFDITPAIVEKCVQLRRTKKIKTPDAIIAATALVIGHTLVTNNEKDFSSIPGLKIVNPHKI